MERRIIAKRSEKEEVEARMASHRERLFAVEQEVKAMERKEMMARHEENKARAAIKTREDAIAVPAAAPRRWTRRGRSRNRSPPRCETAAESTCPRVLLPMPYPYFPQEKLPELPLTVQFWAACRLLRRAAPPPANPFWDGRLLRSKWKPSLDPSRRRLGHRNALRSAPRGLRHDSTALLVRSGAPPPWR
jgi:hypothetical protein